MAVLLDGFTLLVRNSTLEAKPGGVGAFLTDAPNRSVCTDGRLCRIAFMDRDDMERHRARLEAMGIRDRTVADIEVAAICANDPRDLPAWLQVGRYGGHLAAWLVDHDPEPLVVPVSWRPGATTFLAPGEIAERLVFVGREGSADVYEDRSSGQRLYVGRTAGAPPELEEDRARRLQALYAKGTELVSPYLPLAELRKPLTADARRHVEEGVRLLEAVVHEHPLWNAHWVIGMAYRALGDAERSLASLRASYELNPSHADVAREYVGACLALGQGVEAVRAASYNCKLHPDDAGLRSNLGLALLVADRLDDAVAAARQALDMEPDDSITKNLLAFVTDVRDGRRARPTRYP